MSENVNFYQGSKENYNPSEMQGGLYFSKDSKEILLNGESYGNATPADEEDITAESGNLKLRDRAYDADNFSGKGYKILRKNIQKITVPKFDLTISTGCTTDGNIIINETPIAVTTEASTPEVVALLIQSAISGTTVSGAVVTFTSNPIIDYSTTGVSGWVVDSSYQENRNILTQDMINESNTVYEVRYDYDLNGETISIPINSILYFNGGIFQNGTILNIDSFNVVKREQIFNSIKVKSPIDVHSFSNSVFGNSDSSTLYIRKQEDFDRNITNINNGNITKLIVLTDIIINSEIIVLNNLTITSYNNSTISFGKLINITQAIDETDSHYIVQLDDYQTYDAVFDFDKKERLNYAGERKFYTIYGSEMEAWNISSDSKEEDKELVLSDENIYARFKLSDDLLSIIGTVNIGAREDRNNPPIIEGIFVFSKDEYITATLTNLSNAEKSNIVVNRYYNVTNNAFIVTQPIYNYIQSYKKNAILSSKLHYLNIDYGAFKKYRYSKSLRINKVGGDNITYPEKGAIHIQIPFYSTDCMYSLKIKTKYSWYPAELTIRLESYNSLSTMIHFVGQGCFNFQKVWYGSIKTDVNNLYADIWIESPINGKCGVTATPDNWLKDLEIYGELIIDSGVYNSSSADTTNQIRAKTGAYPIEANQIFYEVKDKPEDVDYNDTYTAVDRNYSTESPDIPIILERAGTARLLFKWW